MVFGEGVLEMLVSGSTDSTSAASNAARVRGKTNLSQFGLNTLADCVCPDDDVTPAHVQAYPPPPPPAVNPHTLYWGKPSAAPTQPFA